MKVKRVVAAFLLATTPACMTTRRVAPAQYVPEYHPQAIAVLDGDGASYVLEHPTVNGDMLLGVEPGTPDTVAFPISRLTEATVRGKSTGRTALLVGGIAGVLSLGVVGIVKKGQGGYCKGFGDGGTSEVAGGKDQCDRTGADGGAQP